MISRRLCVPCAKKLEADGKKITLIPSRKFKDCCFNCKRQRYVNKYTIEKKEGDKNA